MNLEQVRRTAEHGPAGEADAGHGIDRVHYAGLCLPERESRRKEALAAHNGMEALFASFSSQG